MNLNTNIQALTSLMNLNSRSGRLLFNIAASFFSRAINLGSTLIIVPVSIAGLGPEQYGFLAVVLSASVFFNYADFGLGLALVNRLSVSECSDAWRNVRPTISRIWSFLLIISLVIGCGGSLVVLALCRLEAYTHFIIRDPLVWITLIIGIAIGFPSSISQRALFALQRNFEAGMWMAAGRVAAVIGVVIAKWYHADISAYVFSLIGLPAVINWISTANLFLFQRRDLCPNFVFFDIKEIWPDLRLGGQFLILNLAIFIQTGIDNILVSAFHGKAAVTAYDVLFRLFYYVPALCSIASAPLWPALRNAISQGDYYWAAKARKRSYYVTLLISVSTSLAMALFYHDIIFAWTGLDLKPQPSLVMAWAIFSILSCIGTVQSMSLNAQGFVGFQAKLLVPLAIVLIFIKILCLEFFDLASMVWSLVVIFTIQLCLFELKANAYRQNENKSIAVAK